MPPLPTGPGWYLPGAIRSGGHVSNSAIRCLTPFVSTVTFYSIVICNYGYIYTVRRYGPSRRDPCRTRDGGLKCATTILGSSGCCGRSNNGRSCAVWPMRESRARRSSDKQRNRRSRAGDRRGPASTVSSTGSWAVPGCGFVVHRGNPKVARDFRSCAVAGARAAPAVRSTLLRSRAAPDFSPLCRGEALPVGLASSGSGGSQASKKDLAADARELPSPRFRQTTLLAS